MFERTGKLSTLIDGLCVPLRSAKHIDEVNANPFITSVVTTPQVAEGLEMRLGVGVCSDPDAAHAEIHAEIAREHLAKLRARPNVIDNSAYIDSAANLSGHAVTIGPGCWIGPNVTIAPGVSVGAHCVLHSGTVLGVPGFNSAALGGRRKIMQSLGGVRLEPFVEILANCTVANAVFGGHTLIDQETLIDNLVYIAHDVQIGRRVQICALANILGRSIIGEEAYIGPSSVIKNGLRVGSRARVTMGAVVTQDVPENAVVSGNFAVSHDRFLHHIRSIR